MLSPFIHQVSSIVSPFLNRRRGGSVVAFSPASLYSSGAQGIWLDPSDLTTMFSDRAGTTPVTPGGWVGLRLDKSKGGVGTNGASRRNLLTYSEQFELSVWAKGRLLTSGMTNVAVAPDGTTTADKIVPDTTLGYHNITSPVGLMTSGQTYSISIYAKANGYNYVAVGNGDGTRQAMFNLSSGAVVSSTASTTPTISGPDVNGWCRCAISFAAGVSNSAQYSVDVDGNGLTSNGNGTSSVLLWGAQLELGSTVSAYQKIIVDWPSTMAGNHAVAPTDAARPIYGVEPKGGRRNLLTWSEDFSSAFWTKSTSPALTLTNQGSGVWRLQAGAGSWYLVQPIAASGTHTMAIDVKSNGAGLDGFQIMMAGNFVGGNRTATSDWVRYSASGSVVSSVTGICYNTSNAAIDLLIRFPQVELGSTATNYQRVTTEFDVTEAGVATCHYCRYDGNNNSMSTAAIDFTATNKMSVFAGVRKLSDAASGVVVESGTDVSLVGGSFLLAYPRSGSVNAPSFLSRGTFTSAAISSSNAYPAPRSSVITGTSDISGDLTTLRENGTSLGQATTDQGAGNYGNYPLFIGRRNNATLPFNGKDYGIIVVGKAASAGEITDTELWLSDKTAEVDVAKSISPNIYTRSGDTILDRANSIIERRTV